MGEKKHIEGSCISMLKGYSVKNKLFKAMLTGPRINVGCFSIPWFIFNLQMKKYIHYCTIIQLAR
jgi:hypothetical protein